MKTNDPPEYSAMDRQIELDRFVAAFESAHVQGLHPQIQDFLPPAEHPLRLPVLVELVRVDLELAWDHGEQRRLESYRDRFPELFRDGPSLEAVAFEEMRLRRLAGEDPPPDEYHGRFDLAGEGPTPTRVVAPGQGVPADENADYSVSLSAPASRMPEPGETVLGFHLLGELGHGAFGRVFLAEQNDLARRKVALKVSSRLPGEAQMLARLQHTHIVPIHSVHRLGLFQAVCMPFFGATTLADVIREVHKGRDAPQSGKELTDTIGMRSATVPGGEPESSRGGYVTKPGLRELTALSYPDAVLWLGLRLADGLAHAHERGILHRDLKPANVLLTDDGQPMLLDFNLAAEADQADSAEIGGTLPYMAPEQIEALIDGRPRGDARSDVYSLGMILFELLTGRLPFPRPESGSPVALRQALAHRRQAPDVRKDNPAVSPAVAAILCHCLAFDPAKRYASARQLQEDLRRQLESLPLRCTPEPSPVERVRKWARRHPRLSSSTTLGAIAAVILLAVTAGFLVRQRHLSQLEATEAHHRLTEAREVLPVLLASRDATPGQVAEGLERCEEAVARYGVLERPDWQHGSLVTLLPPDEQRSVREDMGEVLFLWARGLAWKGNASRALDVNARAAACFDDRLPQPLQVQRVELLRELGREEEPRSVSLAQTPATPRDRYLAMLDRIDRGRLREALPLIREASQRDPRSYVAWLLLGNCHAALRQPAEALDCYDIAVSLGPASPWCVYNRGLLHKDMKRFVLARSDFDRTLELRPDLADALINRALVKMELEDFVGAVADLDRAEKSDPSITRVCFIRARARARMGDREGAARDTQEGLRREPGDALSWVARGVGRLSTPPPDVDGALGDFDRALTINPGLREALQDKAHVLSERLGKLPEAVEVLDRAVSLHPDYVLARLGRGVLLARLGKRDAAHRDALDSLALDQQAGTLYQVANIYALTSKEHPEDRATALKHLRAALRKEPGWVKVANGDADLGPVRDDPAFRKIVREAADELAETPS